MHKLIIALTLLFAGSTQAISADERHKYVGYYWNEDQSAIVQLSLTGDSIEGRTRWSSTGKGQLDANNQDPALQSRPIEGLVFLYGFKYNEKKNRWKDGNIYDPNNGKTYDAKLTLKNNGQTLEMRGYIGISLLGRTEKFARVTTDNIPAGLLDAIRSVLYTE